ncbi:Mesoderm posterior protein 1 [Liparis tanakae]|uniref:Mesoderm posterior protein 1 n=1 Tax=Liparis tanakae TaxID=230148 RepID=A0A4Z2HYZ9_9TELE|nr:Mesoderm posterior protein 1 [Liparis tanakae]
MKPLLPGCGVQDRQPGPGLHQRRSPVQRVVGSVRSSSDQSSQASEADCCPNSTRSVSCELVFGSHLVPELPCFPWDTPPSPTPPTHHHQHHPPSPGRGVGPAPRASQGLEVAAGGDTSHLLPHIWSGLMVLLTVLSALPTGHTDCSRKTTTTTTTAAMEVTYCSPLQLQDNSFLFESLLDKPYNPLAYDPASDAGYFSAGSSSLSPTSSVDSFCFSPTSLQAAGSEPNATDCFVFKSPAAPRLTQGTPLTPRSGSSAATLSIAKKSRSRYPGKKRETASEREKLRMRDLTKALQHLRTYLPPSVAPAGQTLTKIETLRLTIRYISYLSAQLGLSEEALEQRASGFAEQPQNLSQFLGQPAASYSHQEPACLTISSEHLSSLQSSYQRLLQRRGGRAKLPGVVFFELQQLGRDRRGYWDSNLNVGINRSEL